MERTAPVRIEFSEPVGKDKIGEAVYVSPRPSASPTFTWDKNALVIQLPESLAANLTYLVTIAARIPDRRGNRLAEPFVLAFSTGAAIDSGTISGMVFDRDKPGSNAQVLLFMLPLDSVNALFAAPDYITECGSEGGYTFSFLPNGAYRAMAIEDKNKNRQLDRGEKAGVGAFDVDLTPESSRPAPLDLYLRETDTTRFELVRCRVNLDRVLLAEFSHAVDSISAGSALWAVGPVSSAEQPRIECLELELKNPKTVRVLLRGATTGVSYRLSVQRLTDVFGTEIDSAGNTGEFFWPAAPDTIAPTVLLSMPAHRESRVESRRALEAWFSEAVDSGRVDTAFLVTDSTGARVAGSFAWPCRWKMVFTPESALAPRMMYMMGLDSGSVVDLAGNAAGQRWAASFTTLNPEDQGGMAGSVTVSRPDWRDKPIILQFVSLDKNPPVEQRLQGDTRFEYELAAGRYTIRAFVDLNENHRFDLGSALPFVFAEPRFQFSDTLEVRARFVTEGVDLIIP